MMLVSAFMTFLALFACRPVGALAAQTSVTASSKRLASAPTEGAATLDTSWAPQFRAPQLTPTTFLIISSPSQGKVSYTELKNFKSTYGRTFPLIDSGLGMPTAIAFDRERGDLYVVDQQALKIFRYGVRVKESRDRNGKLVRSLVTDANRLTILAGRNASDVTVDCNGDVFYSDQAGKSINKITAAVMEKIADGELEAETLKVVSEKEQEAADAALVAGALDGPVGAEESQPEASETSIMSIYEGSLNPRVSVPAGVVSDGVRLYWTNGQDGRASGSVVRGEANPKPPPTTGEGSDPQPFPAETIADNAEVAYGIAKSNNLVFFSSTQADGQGVVYGSNSQTNDGNVLPFAMGLMEPRGLVWDGDNTVFVADRGSNAVYSFPVGRLQEAAPLTKGVEILDAYGVAILVEGDDAFALKAGAARSGTGFVLVLIACLFSLL